MNRSRVSIVGISASIKMPNKGLLRISDAADYLNVSAKTLRRWDKSGKLRPDRTEGNQRLYSKELIDKYLGKVSEEVIVKSKFVFPNFAKYIFIGTSIASLIIFLIIFNNKRVDNKISKSIDNTSKVLGASTQTLNDMVFKIRVPSEFLESATFNKNILAPNVLYSLKAGNGIKITDGQDPTISITADANNSGWKLDSNKVSLTNPNVLVDVVGTGQFSGSLKTGGDLTVAGNIFDSSLTSGLVQADSSGKLSSLSSVSASMGGTGLTSYAKGDLLYSSATNVLSPLNIGLLNQVLTVSSDGVPTWSAAQNTSGWTNSAGLLSPSNTSQDVVIGGTATSSAKFAFENVSSGTPTASIAGSINGVSTYITGNGTLATTNMNTLTLGSPTTGNINIAAGTTIAPTQPGATTLALKASTNSPGNVIDIMNSSGSTSFFSINSAGTMTVNGSTLTNAGLLESGGAIHLTNSANSIVGTAIEGGWTLNSHTFTYRRNISVTNADAAITLPNNYEVAVTISGTNASQIYSNTQSNNNDFRISNGTTEIGRNITSYTSSNISFTFQLQSSINALATDSNYYIYYKNSTLATAGPNYTASFQIDSADNVSAWTSSDGGYRLAQEATTKQEGTGSIKVTATTGNFPTTATTSQGQLSSGVSKQATILTSVSGTNYVYSIGGQNGAIPQTGVYKSTVDGSGNLGSFSTTSQGQLSSGVTSGTVVTALQTPDSGTGADGTLDLSLGASAGGCNGVEMSWNAGSSTCTINVATSYVTGPALTAATGTGANAFTIPSGSNSGKVLEVLGNSSAITNYYDPSNNTFSAGPALGANAGSGSNSFTIPSGTNAGKILVVMAGTTATTRIFDPSSNTFGNGPNLSANAGEASHSFTIPSGSNAGKILVVHAGTSGTTSIFDPSTNTFSAGPALGANAGFGSNSFSIPSGSNAGKILTVIAGGTTTTKIFDPATSTYGAGPDLGATANYGALSFSIPSGSNAGKILTVTGNNSVTTRIFDPATSTYGAGPNLATYSGYYAFAFTIPSGTTNAGKIFVMPGYGGALPSVYDPSTNTFQPATSLTIAYRQGVFVIPSGTYSGQVIMPTGSGGTASVRIDWGKSTYNFTSINIPGGTTLTTNGPIYATSSQPQYQLTLKATGTVTIAGSISLDGKGYATGNTSYTGCNGVAGNGFGPGCGSYSTITLGSGAGGYGGAGGAGANGSVAGGSAYSTAEPGSGGGFANGNLATDGNGGGGITINSGGNMTVSTISANGTAGHNSTWGGGGGGSGGNITLSSAGAITINGSLSAAGGNGGTSGASYSGGGGGGGGRISLQDSDGVVSGTTSVTFGTGGTGGSGGNGVNGSAGAVTTSAPLKSIYLIGGLNGTAQTTVYKAAIDSSGNIGAWSAASQNALPQGLYNHTSNSLAIGTTTYLYTLGGNNGTSDQTTVYKSTIDTSNNVGAWSTTSQGQLPQGLSELTSTIVNISGTNYLYVIGGKNSSTAQTTVYKATIDGSGNVGAFSTTSQGQLSSGVYGHSTLNATVNGTNYLYVMGGKNTSGTTQNAVYQAALDGSGNVGTWTTVGQNTLSQTLYGASSLVNTTGGTQYIYILGGNNGTSDQTTVYRGQLDPAVWTNYKATNTIAAIDLSNKSAIQFKTYSNVTGTPASFKFSKDGVTWQTCNFTVSSANVWETKTCDISALAASAKNAVTKLQFDSSSATVTPFTLYFDDIEGLTASYTGAAPTLVNSTATLGAANLDLNAQGTGGVRINYDGVNALAGTGGVTVYNGGTTTLFTIDGTGKVGVGVTSPNTKLAVAGLTGTSSYNLVRVNTATGDFYYDTSTQRNKLNIQDLNTDFTKILNLQPKTYTDKASGEQEIGYIAEEVNALGLSDLVLFDQNGIPNGLKYDRIPLYILEVVKSQQKIIDGLATSFKTQSLSVSGNASLGDTVVTGKLNVGKLTFDNLNGSLDAIGTLQIQPLDLGNVQIAGNKVEIDTNGNMNIKTGVIMGNSTFRNSEILPAGQTQIIITKNWDSIPTTIIATPNYKTSVWVENKSSQGFVIKVDSVSPTDQEIDWQAMW